MMTICSRLVVLLAYFFAASAFSVAPLQSGRQKSFLMAEWDSDTSAIGGGSGSLEQIEYKIFPDGRVEEIVRGVKGANCQKVTEEINQALGEVISTTPTEEMYEQELVIDQTISLSDDGTNWEGSTSW